MSGLSEPVTSRAGAALLSRSYEFLILRRQGDLLWIRLNDPKRANALAPAMIEELVAVYRHPWRTDGVRALLLTGAGKNFSAGADLAHLRRLMDASPDENRKDSEALRALFESVLRQDALTLALVQGACVAGGCGLATAHDFVVAAEDARFLYSEVKIGFVAALVATYLSLRVRGSDLRELLLFPRFVEAPMALEMGLANRVVSRDGLEEAGERLAGEILANASSQSIASTKQLLLDVLGRPLPNALARATEVNAAARATADCKHGIATFLEEKKAPTWRS